MNPSLLNPKSNSSNPVLNCTESTVGMTAPTALPPPSLNHNPNLDEPFDMTFALSKAGFDEDDA